MPEERIELENVFEPDEPEEEALESLIGKLPEPMAATIKAMGMLLNPPLPKPDKSAKAMRGVPTFVPLMPEQMEFRVVVLKDFEQAATLEEYLNNGWYLSPSTLFNSNYAYAIISRPIETEATTKTEED